MRGIVVIVLALVVAVVSARGQEADYQYRAAANVSLFDVGRFNFTTYGEASWSSGETRPFAYLVSPRLSYRLTEWLTTGVNYTFIEASVLDAATGSVDRVDSQRAEFELNPGFRLGERFRFRLRNRYEHRWLANGTQDDRTRLRFEFYWETPQWKPLKEIYAFDEVFIDWTNTRVSINRVMPLGLNWRLAERVGLRTFYFWEQRYGLNGKPTENSHVFYTLFDVRLTK
jgi:hypothetical protein